MLRRVLDVIAWTRPWCQRYRQGGGRRVALAQRRASWAAPLGSTVALHSPTFAHPVRLRASDAKVFAQVFGATIGLTAVELANLFPSAKVLALEIYLHNTRARAGAGGDLHVVVRAECTGD